MQSKILVADDEPANRQLFEEILCARGHRVILAHDGQSALEEIERHNPDLILLDVMMPKINGFEVCRRVKSSPETRLVPVVLVTGLSAIEDRVRGIEAGADDFLNKPIESTELLARVRSLLNLKAYTDEMERAETVLFALARSIEGKDPYTAGHCERLSEYSECLGRRMALSEEELTALRRASIIHDIGKVAVPETILLKPGKLTPDEWKVMREHPVVGERICAPLKSFRLVLPIIRHHHEKLDGTGYPDGLKGDEIPLTARLLSIVDVYDALATDRPYRHALSSAKVLETMAGEVSKGWWDPRLFAAFRALLANGNQVGREYPVSVRNEVGAKP